MYLKGSGGPNGHPRGRFVTIRNSENLCHKVCPFSISHHDTVLFIQFALCAFGKFQAERFHCFRVKNGRGISPPKCFKSGGNFHPIHTIALHNHSLAVFFSRPTVSNIYRVIFRCKELYIVFLTLRVNRPGNEHFRFGVVRDPFAPLERILEHGGGQQRPPVTIRHTRFLCILRYATHVIACTCAAE